MARQKEYPADHSDAYNLFILVLTVFSLVLMVLLLLPLDKETLLLLQFYDILICLVFLADFLINLKTTSKKSDYLIGDRGWLDLLGSIPSIGAVFKYSVIFRVARLSRFERILQSREGKGRAAMVTDVIHNRHRYVGYITILLAIILLTTASALILQFESHAPEAKITTGWQAFWFSIVTITTVGFGDFFPVTVLGQLTAMFIMISGLGVIAVLASLLSHLLIGSTNGLEEDGDAGRVTVEQDIADIKSEMAAMRRMLEKMTLEDDK